MREVGIDEPVSGVRRFTFDRPGRKNALNAEMREFLIAEVTRALNDSQVKAIMLAGANGDFSAGGDLERLAAIPADRFRAYLARGHALVRLLAHSPKPLICQFQGIAAGGGAALALTADVIVAGRSSRIALPFIRIGFVPDWGSAWTLSRRVGLARAREICLLGRAIEAEEAVKLGLFDRCVADDAVEMEALTIATRLAEGPRNATALTKRFFAALPDNLDAALDMELNLQSECFPGPEFEEGVAAFLQKRKPRFP